jgi:hypothetical protein
MPTILRLRSITKERNHHISSKRYKTWDTQQCILPMWNQGPLQSQRPHVHGRHGGYPHQQWNDTQYFADNKSSDVIGCRSQTWRIVHQRQHSSLHATHTWGNGHLQICVTIQTGNLTAHALLINKILPKAFKAVDMQFHWLRCREAQDQYQIYWRPGTQNLVDYWRKHHPASHHKAFWPQILT